MDDSRDRHRRNLWLGIGLGCVGCLVIVILPITLAVVAPIFLRARQRAQQTTCMAHIHDLGMALNMYRDDHDGRFPAAATWRDDTAKYVDDPEAWHCPADKVDHPSSYAFNANLSGLDGRAVLNPGGVVTLFESTSTHPNPSDLGISWPVPGRHRAPGDARGNHAAYADGHVRATTRLLPSDLKPQLSPAP